MTVNALPAAITATSSYAPAAATQTAAPRQQEVAKPSQQIERAPSPLPESIPSVNTQGQKIGTRISTQA